jgi:hypothetical protein
MVFFSHQFVGSLGQPWISAARKQEKSDGALARSLLADLIS